MARISKLHFLHTIIAAGAFLSVLIRPAAAQNNTVSVYNKTAYGYSYTGCFTSGPETPALDQGTNLTSPGRMTPPACLHACRASAVFLKVSRENHLKYTKHRNDTNTDSVTTCDNDNKNNNNNNNAMVQAANDTSDYSDTEYQYAGLAYNADQDLSVCVCSDGLAIASENVTDDQCSYPCDGNTTWSCGGPGLIVLYNLTEADDEKGQPPIRPPFPHHGQPEDHYPNGATIVNGVSSGLLISAFLVAFGSL